MNSIVNMKYVIEFVEYDEKQAYQQYYYSKWPRRRTSTRSSKGNLRKEDDGVTKEHANEAGDWYEFQWNTGCYRF